MTLQPHSQPNWTKPFALALTLVVLGGGAVWLEYKHKPAVEEKESESKKFFNLKGRPIESLRIFDGSRTTAISCLDLEKNLCKVEDQSHWELNIPAHLKADNSNVSSLLSALNNLNINETIDLSSETPEKRAQLLKDYKLDSASRKPDADKQIEIKFKGGETQTLYFGDTHPMGESIFTLRNSDENKVYLAPTYFKSNFEKNTAYWRDKRLFMVAASEFTAFEFNSNEEKKKANIRAKKADGKWILITGNKKTEDYLAGDIENIDNLLTSVSYLAAKDFVEEDKRDPKAVKALKGAKKILQYDLTLNSKSEKDKAESIKLELFLTQKPEKLYATVSNLDPLFELEVSSKDRISKTLNDLRLAKLITSMERFTMSQIEISGANIGAPVTYSHKDTKWIRDSDKKEMMADTIQVFLDHISGNKIKEFVSAEKTPAGSDKGLKIALGDEKDAKKRQILFWKVKEKDKESLYAKDLTSKRNEVFLIDSSVAEALPWEKSTFENASKVAKPLSAPPGHAHDHEHED